MLVHRPSIISTKLLSEVIKANMIQKFQYTNSTSDGCEGTGGQPQLEHGLPVPCAGLLTLASLGLAFSGPHELTTRRAAQDQQIGARSHPPLRPAPLQDKTAAVGPATRRKLHARNGACCQPGAERGLPGAQPARKRDLQVVQESPREGEGDSGNVDHNTGTEGPRKRCTDEGEEM